jgi:endonuclease/exonuclease/phosphatase family metal-dependent hydrolase
VDCFAEATRALPVVPPEERAALLTRPAEASVHARAAARLSGLRCVEVSPPPQPTPGAPLAAARVVAWNAERGRFLDGAAGMLRAAGADALLLSELDVGMARTEQRHTLRELAARLRLGFAFGVEFLELGLGDPAERGRCAGAANDVGYHGGAVASERPLARPVLVRLDAGGDWFDGRRGERRVGGRIAVLATLEVAGVPVTLASVHLESHADPSLRDAQAAALLAALDAYAPGAPALVGGDLNTHSLGSAELEDRAALGRALRADPRRFAEPFGHEPLFERLAAAGFDRTSCNVAGASTVRQRGAAGSERGVLRLDWFFARDLGCSDPEVLAALDPATGEALSDHEAIAVTIRPSG